ncbi:MAG: DUF5682 family protein [Mycobacteriales bacterium]
MGATFLGVRHHSPACARLVASTIESLRPAYVLVEGPADINDRLDELLLEHELPVAVFSWYRDGESQHASWTPFCEYSPEWVALTAGTACGAEVRFIDLPAWRPEFAERTNRYSDAELRHAEATERLCRSFAVDNIDALWDHLFEIEPAEGLAERLDTYFDLLRGESATGATDTAREEYMARWVRAALAAAGDRPVVVVTGGFHRPALRTLAEPAGDGGWPAVPEPPAGAAGGSYLVPYSFRRLDAFVGYQAGMPSPGYYQLLWENGPERAAAGTVAAVAGRLRARRQLVSTADLVAARALTDGLAMLRGHRWPARTDVLDGLVGALVSDDIDQPLPWTVRGPLAPGAHPVVVEMVAALAGDRYGRLHPDTPAPPLVHDTDHELERLGLTGARHLVLALDRDPDAERSRTLHRLRVLRVPGFARHSGPATGADPDLTESWELKPSDDRRAALIEAGAYGATLAAAAAARLQERAGLAGADVGQLADVLFDAALCGILPLADRIAASVADGVAGARELAPLGRALATAVGLWRYDTVLGGARSPVFGEVIAAAVTRTQWLVEGVRGGPAPADPGRLAAVAALRDALVHAGDALGLDRSAAVAVAGRVAADTASPPDLRGAVFGLAWSVAGAPGDPVRAVRGVAGPRTLGDWLSGLFALSRDELLEPGSAMLDVLDEIVGEMTEHDFLVALPALRQAFEYFPPRERETIARGLLDRRGAAGSARALLRTGADPVLVAEGRALAARVAEVLAREGLDREEAG